MRVLVRGLGNIGTTLVNLLLRYQEALGIDQVIAHKSRPLAFLEPDLAHLRARGAQVLVGADECERALAGADYIFDCRQAGAPRADQAYYERADHVRGVCAQGTETGFGQPFVTGVNDQTAHGARLVQIASCNTHALVSLLRTLAGARLEQLISADFVIARRAEDLGNHDRLVSGTVVARHRDPHSGTHHAEDARRVFATMGVAPTVTSSDVTTPSQLLHTVRFALRLAGSLTEDQALAAIMGAERLACTNKFDSNRVFELGRRYGFQGRIYAHAIVVANNLLVSPAADPAHPDAVEIRGWAFVPQEGNTLLSTLDAFALQTGHANRRTLLAQLQADLLSSEW